MASVLADTNNVLPRSHSSSDIPNFVTVDFKLAQPDIHTDVLPRAASYTCLPVLENPSYQPDKDPSPDVPAGIFAGVAVEDASSIRKLAEGRRSTVSVVQDEIPRIGRTKSLVSRPKSWIQRAVKGSPERKPMLGSKNQSEILPNPVAKVPPEKPRSVPESFASFARKTWISSSRSPSPIGRSRQKNTIEDTVNQENSRSAGPSRSSSPRKPLSTLSQSELATTGSSSSSSLRTLTRKSSSLSNRLRFSKPKLDHTIGFRDVNTSDSSLSGSLSDKDSIAKDPIAVPPIPKAFVRDKYTGFGKDRSRKKDELWSAFRTLDSDYQKFQSKSHALRANVVRSTLLPFLRNYGQHPSNKNLRPEDIDKRIGILNRWWTGLLDMLDGQNNQHLSGVDRPVVLEAITGIMTRPEWRLAPSYFAPVADRNPLQPLPRSRSSASLNSSGSQFLAESVYHNVRNMFIQNLLAQMALVVDKMSLRNAPASLVTFCGKAAAYAFFFCPGVADVLANIWAIKAEKIRRVVDEFGLVPRAQGANGIDDIITDFPPNLHSLGWRSSKSLIGQLRQRHNLPLGAAKISWHGPWVSRWCGRDSDLFFVFCKQYHILCEEFLPSAAPLNEKARAPGFVVIHAQLLTALDATIHRQPSNDSALSALSLTFDEVLSGADASAAALPLPLSSNVARLMAENRLIMLLRDFLSERPSDFPHARHTFAEAFGATMRAAARKTSKFNHSCCFILCDFLEEALAIYMRFQNSLDILVEYVDWGFWLTVCKKMLESQNTMTEIRLFSFVFGAWNSIASDERRKEVLCFEWLLAEDTFRKYYLHWCPMVRAYYMRLLCWRACRFDGEGSPMDIKIYGRISDGLKLVWSHYLYQKNEAERLDMYSPSIAPCNPAPGRRLLIIRNDNQIPTSNLFLGFDGNIDGSSTPKTQETAYKRHSSLAGLVRPTPTEIDVLDATSGSKKRWSLLGKIMPFSSPNSSDGLGHNAHAPPIPGQKSLTPLEQARQATASLRSRSPLQITPKSSSSSLSDSAPSTPTHCPFSFKFSLEWTPPPTHAFGPGHTHLAQEQILRVPPPNSNPGSAQALLSRTPRLLPPRLPTPTHTFLVGCLPDTSNEVFAIKPEGPDGAAAAQTKYAGRALAEWALVVKECNNFVERRKAEGVPDLKFIEVPILGVERFRKYA